MKEAHYGIVYQNTPSMPMGYYLTYPQQHFDTGDRVVLQPARESRHFARRHGYAGHSRPMLKEIRAQAGDFVCIRDKALIINQHQRYQRYQYDRKGQPLPRPTLCRRLRSGEYIVIGTSSPYSFDSRYNGIVQQQQIIAKAVKL